MIQFTKTNILKIQFYIQFNKTQQRYFNIFKATRPDQSIPFDSITRKIKETEGISIISEYAGDYTEMINSSREKIKTKDVEKTSSGE